MEFAIVTIGVIAVLLLGVNYVLIYYYQKAKRELSESSKIAAESGVLCSKLASDLEKSTAENRDNSHKLRESELRCATLEERLESQLKIADERRATEEELRKKFESDFKNLSAQMFDGAREKITSANSQQLGLILNPLKENLKNFAARVEDLNAEDMKTRASFESQIKMLGQTNAEMSKETRNLVNALKGDNKKAGNWGETILKRLLENCGFVEGREFTTQETFKTEDEFGARSKMLRPDVIIKLPSDRCVIVDSKVSILDYQAYCSETDDSKKKSDFSKFDDSVRHHITGLAEKHYEKIDGLKNPDFVILFMPIEPAYSSLVETDPEIWDFAFSRKIIIVTPSTLLGMLKIIENMWRMEKQTRNADAIAALGGKLYDSVAKFTEDFSEIGKRLEQLCAAHEKSKKSLLEGNNNVVRCATRLSDFGVKSKKSISKELLEQAAELPVESDSQS